PDWVQGLDDGTDWAAPEFGESEWDTAPGGSGALRGEEAELSGGYYPDTLLDQYYPDSDGLNKEAFFFRTEVSIDETDLNEDTVLLVSLRSDADPIVSVTRARVVGYHTR